MRPLAVFVYVGDVRKGINVRVLFFCGVWGGRFGGEDWFPGGCLALRLLQGRVVWTCGVVWSRGYFCYGFDGCCPVVGLVLVIRHLCPILGLANGVEVGNLKLVVYVLVLRGIVA